MDEKINFIVKYKNMMNDICKSIYDLWYLSDLKGDVVRWGELYYDMNEDKISDEDNQKKFKALTQKLYTLSLDFNKDDDDLESDDDCDLYGFNKDEYKVITSIDGCDNTHLKDEHIDFKREMLENNHVCAIYTSKENTYSDEIYIRPKYANHSKIKFAVWLANFYAAECSVEENGWVRIWWD